MAYHYRWQVYGEYRRRSLLSGIKRVIRGMSNEVIPLKRQVMGREVVIAVTEGRLDFGPWEQIFYGEFDGRRPKRVLVKIIGA